MPRLQRNIIRAWSEPQMRKPNVIVFFTDQQRHDTTGAHGNPMGLTPNYDRIAREGTHLVNYFSCQPLCGPARAAMQTGQYPTQIGCFRNDIPLPQNAETIAKVFGGNGYTTAYIGKWHLGTQDPVPKQERGGYQHWLGANLLEYCSDAYDTILFDDNNERRKLPGYRVDALTDAAIRFCDQHQREPFFLFLSFLEPHHQNHVDGYVAPEGRGVTSGLWLPPDLAALGGTSSFHLGGYYGIVRRLDEAFGRLMDALRSLQLLDDTIVLFTSDHGCHFKTRNDEYKRTCHESAVRVPALLTGPGFIGGGEVRALINTVDVVPTLLDAAGLSVPNSVAGQSILPVVRDSRAPWRRDIFFQTSEAETGRALRTHRWKYGVVTNGAPYPYERDMRPNSERYVEAYLYDLKNDPYELVNLAGMPVCRELADHLKSKLLRWVAEIEGGPPPHIENAKHREAYQRRIYREEIDA
jgi:arylsulfatase A-like enzyme